MQFWNKFNLIWRFFEISYFHW